MICPGRQRWNAKIICSRLPRSLGNRGLRQPILFAILNFNGGVVGLDDAGLEEFFFVERVQERERVVAVARLQWASRSPLFNYLVSTRFGKHSFGSEPSACRSLFSKPFCRSGFYHVFKRTDTLRPLSCHHGYYRKHTFLKNFASVFCAANV